MLRKTKFKMEGQVQTVKATLKPQMAAAFREEEIVPVSKMLFDENLGSIPKQAVFARRVKKDRNREGEPISKIMLTWPKAGKRTMIDAGYAKEKGWLVKTEDGQLAFGLSELGHEVDPTQELGSRSRWIA